jgi:ATP-dependent exoDNAse (exonuclease V) alpha subunit
VFFNGQKKEKKMDTDWIKKNLYGLREPRDNGVSNNNSSLDVEQKRDIVTQQTRIFEGRCDYEWSEAQGSNYKDIFKLCEYGDIVFRNVSTSTVRETMTRMRTRKIYSQEVFPSRLFRYRIVAARTDKDIKRGAFKVFKAVRCEMTPLPFDNTVMKVLLLDIAGMAAPDFHRFLSIGPWVLDSNYHNHKEHYRYTLLDILEAFCNPINMADDNTGGGGLLDINTDDSDTTKLAKVFINELLSPHDQLLSSLVKLSTDYEARMYFFYSQIAELSKYYTRRHLLAIQWRSEDYEKGPYVKLLETIRTRPDLLCFKATIPDTLRWVCPVGDSDAQDDTTDARKKSGKNPKLPELPYKKFKEILGMHDDTIDHTKADIQKKVRVYIYHVLQCDHNNDKHSYTDRDDLASKCKTEFRELSGAAMFDDGTDIMNMGIDEMEAHEARKEKEDEATKEDPVKVNVERAVEWLRKHKVVFTNADRVYLKNSYVDEMCIAQCFGKLMEKKISQMYTQMIDEDEGEVTTTTNAPNLADLFTAEVDGLCSEQMKAIIHHRQHPILLVTGKAGCGKTKLLSHVMKLYKPGEVIATAFQGRNAGDLAKTLTGYCFTTHQLVLTHDAHCTGSPYGIHKKNNNNKNNNTSTSSATSTTSSKKWGKTKIGLEYNTCIFEDVKVLIADELSLLYPGIFAKLLAALVTCGKLESVVLTGDINQLPSLRPGNLIRDLFEAFSLMNCAFTFQHDHRSKAQMIGRNADAIRDRRVDDLEFDQDTVQLVNRKVELSNPPQTPWSMRFPQKRKASEAASENSVERVITELLEANRFDEYDHHIITRTNKYKAEIISAVEKHYLRQSGEYELAELYDQKPNTVLYVGRKVMFKVNIHELQIANNDILILKAIEDVYQQREDELGEGGEERVYGHEIMCAVSNTGEFVRSGYARRYVFSTLDGSREIRLEHGSEYYKYLNKASATTVHAFQGAQIKSIIFVMPFCCEFDTREAIYTAFTRASEKFIFVGVPQSLVTAVSRDEPKRRSTLSQRIIETCEKYAGEFPVVTDQHPTVRAQIDAEVTHTLHETRKTAKRAELDKRRAMLRHLEDVRREKEASMCGELPEEVWLDVLCAIAQQASPTDPSAVARILQFRRVCTQWRDICMDNALWKILTHRIVDRKQVDSFEGETSSQERNYFHFFWNNCTALKKFWVCPSCKKYVSEERVRQTYARTTKAPSNDATKMEIDVPHFASFRLKCYTAKCARVFKVKVKLALRQHPTVKEKCNRAILDAQLEGMKPKYNFLFVKNLLKNKIQ